MYPQPTLTQTPLDSHQQHPTMTPTSAHNSPPPIPAATIAVRQHLPTFPSPCTSPPLHTYANTDAAADAAAAHSARYFPGFCTPRVGSDNESSSDESDSEDDEHLQPGFANSRRQRRHSSGRHSSSRSGSRKNSSQRSFFRSLHDQIRESESQSSTSTWNNNTGGDSSAEEGEISIRTPQSPPLSMRPHYSYNSKSSASSGFLSPPHSKSGIHKAPSNEHEAFKHHQRRVQLLQVQLLKQQQLQLQQVWLQRASSSKPSSTTTSAGISGGRPLLGGLGVVASAPTTPPVLMAKGSMGPHMDTTHAQQHQRLLAEAAERAQLGVMLRELHQLEM